MNYHTNHSEYADLFLNIPSQFKVLSTQPELIIIDKPNPIGKITLTIFMLPFVILFIGHCFMLIYGLFAILTFNFREFFYIISYGKDDFFYIFVFVFTFLLLLVAASSALVSLFGQGRKIHATLQSLTIIDRFGFGGKFDREVSILAENIDRFKRFHLSDGVNGDSWKIEVITNQKLYDRDVSFPSWFPQRWITQDLLTKINYQTIEIFSFSHPRSVDWLGKVLAEFYSVDYIFYQ